VFEAVAEQPLRLSVDHRLGQRASALVHQRVEVADQGRPDWQLSGASALAAHNHGAVTVVGSQVGKVDGDRLTDAQAEAGQKADQDPVADGEVGVVGAVGGGQEGADFGHGDTDGGREVPVDGGAVDRSGRVGPHQVVFEEVGVPAGQGGQPSGHGGRRRWPSAVGLLGQPGVDVAAVGGPGVEAAALQPGQPVSQVAEVGAAGVQRAAGAQPRDGGSVAGPLAVAVGQRQRRHRRGDRGVRVRVRRRGRVAQVRVGQGSGQQAPGPSGRPRQMRQRFVCRQPFGASRRVYAPGDISLALRHPAGTPTVPTTAHRR
jgi:hypothetical protein